MKIEMLAGELTGVAETLKQVEADAMVSAERILEYAGTKTIEILRSFIAETQPPVRKGDPPRPARFGHWADISGQLAASYSHKVERTFDGARLTIMNGAEYAAALEAKEGYFVLGAVTDKGGPVEDAIRQAVAIIAPDWKVMSYD